MLTNTSFPASTCHLEKNIPESRTTGQFIVYFSSVLFKLFLPVSFVLIINNMYMSANAIVQYYMYVLVENRLF